MFRKKFENKPFANLKGSDRKKLVNSICAQFKIVENTEVGNDGDNDSTAGPAVAANTLKARVVPREIRSAKILTANGTKAQLYSDVEGVPLWIRFEQLTLEDQNQKTPPLKDLLVPTIYTLWRCPDLAWKLLTPRGTIDNLQSGADLMIPGVFEPLPAHAPVGTVVAICRLNSPNVAVGVGVCVTDCSEGVLDPDHMKGKAAITVTVIDDKLFTSVRGNVVIPDEDDMLRQIEDLKAGEKKEEGEATNDEEGSNAVSQEGEQEIIKDTGQDEPETLQEHIQEPQGQGEPQMVEEGNEDKISEGNTATASNDEGTATETAEEVERLFELALLQALRKAIDGDKIPCPIGSSAFLSNYIIPNLAYNNGNVVMKRTSWKKASKFLKIMEKKKLLKCKERSGDVVIQSVAGKENKTVAEFHLYKPRKPQQQQPQQPQQQQDEDETEKLSKDILSASISKQAGSSAGIMIAKEYFRPRSAAHALFNDMQASSTGYYQSGDLRTVVNGYVNKHGLVDKSNPKQILVDDVLLKALGLKKGERHVPRDRLVELLQGNCAPFHKITASDKQDSQPLAKGRIPSITVTGERRMGRKVVTKVEGLELFHIDPVLFAEALRVACAGSTTVNAIKEGSDAKQVLVQGNQIVNIKKELEKRGVRATWIRVNDSKISK